MSYLITASGRRVDIPDPLPGQVTIEDIATHLSRIPRFVGATNRPLSVAQHSVVVAYISAALVDTSPTVPLHLSGALRSEMIREGLAHDFAEYLTGDVPTPLKRMVPDFKVIEHKIDSAIRRELGLAKGMPPLVKTADTIALLLEDRLYRDGKMRLHIDVPFEVEEAMKRVESADWYHLAWDIASLNLHSTEARDLLLQEWERVNA